MSCDHPRKAYWKPDLSGITFKSPGKNAEELQIPCRYCTGCRLDHRTNWSTRMMHEAQMHPSSQFVTLTYDDDHLPEGGNLYEVDMQKFFRRLRKKEAPNKIRFVYSSEYGDQTSRPHYHAIIFGLDLDDLEQIASNDRGEPLYQSKYLDSIWAKGRVVIGEVTHQSCGYVAGYMLKDSMGNHKKTDVDGKPLPYEVINTTTGEVSERKRPFARYSNRPGIGKPWLDKYLSDVFPDDFVVLEGGKIRGVPDYYLRQLEKLDPELYEKIKAKRLEALKDPKIFYETTPHRRQTKAVVRDAKISQFKRGSDQSQDENIFYIEDDQ